MDSAEQAERILKYAKTLDYEYEALAGIRRSWTLEDKECQALALADAQVWATLHLARVTAHNKENSWHKNNLNQ